MSRRGRKNRKLSGNLLPIIPWFHIKNVTIFLLPFPCLKVTEDFNDPPVPVIPHSWYHICFGLDTVSGLLRFVVNGIEVVNGEKKYFQDTKTWKPESVIEKIAGKR